MDDEMRRSDGACANGNNLSTVDQALRGEVQNLRLEPEQNVEIGPDSSHGRTVRLETFRDLQGLGFVPRAAKEDAVASAIRQDDKSVFEFVMAHPGEQPSHCECSDGPPARAATPLRAQFDRVRPSFNPALASVITEAAGIALDWDSPVVGLVRRRYLDLVSKIPIGLVLLKDIVITRKATLTIAPKTKVLLANNIYIHDTGRLVTHGGYLRIWANSVTRWEDRIIDVQMPQVPWALGN